ncbi:MAG: hypothetical protein U5J64_06745 [Halobacteriales archaeon]|nr:hypothetical protein [Halobacteriales archaeon]
MTSENKNRNDTKEYKEVQYGPRRVKIPSEWDFARLGESEYTHLITQGPNPDYSKGELSDEYRALKTKDVYDDGIKYESADRISPEVFKNRSKYQLQEDDVLVAIVGRGSIGKSHIFREQENREYICHSSDWTCPPEYREHSSFVSPSLLSISRCERALFAEYHRIHGSGSSSD